MKIISIQPESFTDNIWAGPRGEIVEGKRQPYPFSVTEDGKVEDQDFWQGDPSGVIGFQAYVERQQVDLWWADAVANPDAIVGMFPVMTQTGGPLYTYTIAIESVTVREVPA